jgi:hypothetical protein
LPNRIRLVFAAVLAGGVASGIAVAYAPSVADLDAAARATGNRRDVADRVGRAIFTTRWSAEVNQISANSLDGHLIIGVRLWGVKFHQPMTRDDFIAEVIALVERTFAAAPATEEIDLWTSVPIGVEKGVVVSGDLAKPTSRTVFSVTVHNGESSSSLRTRIGASGDGVFWDSQWADAALRASK